MTVFKTERLYVMIQGVRQL